MDSHVIYLNVIVNLVGLIIGTVCIGLSLCHVMCNFGASHVILLHWLVELPRIQQYSKEFLITKMII